MDVNSEQIAAVLAVAECKSINKAAEKLFLTQPSLKRRIDALESELGFSIFDRKTNGCTLTAAGTIYFEGIAPLHAEMQEIVRRARESSHSVKLRVCNMQELLFHQKETLLFAFLFRNPQISLERIFSSPSEWPDLTAGNQADFFVSPGTDRTIEAFRKKGLRVISCGPDSLICVTSPEHPIAKRESVFLDDLKPYEVCTGEWLLNNSGLLNCAQASGLKIQSSSAAVSRYKMLDCCRRGSIFLQPLSMIYEYEMVPLACSPPISDFSFQKYIVLRNNTEEPLRLLEAFILEWLKEQSLSKPDLLQTSPSD